MADIPATPPVATAYPPGAVILALRKAGMQEVELPPGSPSLWIIPGSERAVAWQDAVAWLGDVAAAQRRAYLVKPFYRTTEFLMAASTLAGTAGTALLAIVDTDTVSPQVGMVAAVCATASAAAYRFLREKAKEQAALELLNNERERPTQPPRARGDE